MNSSNYIPRARPAYTRLRRAPLPGASAPPHPASCAPRQQQQQNLFSAPGVYLSVLPKNACLQLPLDF
ncbi:hypothetical protein A2U01_0084054 [Trifolium medium]|uniref:Uncharacterized protein n=1 Tax=Trifolium medium TaxID=97028 RepID=A0A392TQT8_9FABA|nr:hypothetical protein [Trifolium medium]